MELTPLKKVVYEKIVVIWGGGAGIISHFQLNSNKLSTEKMATNITNIMVGDWVKVKLLSSFNTIRKQFIYVDILE